MKFKISIIIIILLVIGYGLLITGLNSQAATLEVDYPTISGVSPGSDSDLASYLSYIYLLGLAGVGLAALGALVTGGFMYMLSDTITSKDTAKQWIWGAISGLVLALAAYLILNTINPDLVNWSLILPS